MMDRKKVLQFAKTRGYDSIRKRRKTWNGYDVYEPIYRKGVISYIGLPLVILVKENEIRLSTPQESFELL